MDPNNDQQALATTGLPTDMWQEILQYLNVDNKEISYVSKQFLTAWRAGVVGIRFHLPTEYFNNRIRHRTAAKMYPFLRYIHFANTSHPVLPQSLLLTANGRAGGGGPKGKVAVGLSLYISNYDSSSSRTGRSSAYRALVKFPGLAQIVTYLMVGQDRFVQDQLGFYGDSSSSDEAKEPIDTWQLVAQLPNLTFLEVRLHSGYSDLARTALGQLKNLTHLRLRRAANICCETASVIGRLPELRHLWLEYIDENTPQKLLASLVGEGIELETLTLHGSICHRTGFGLELCHLVKAPYLRQLTLAGTGQAGGKRLRFARVNWTIHSSGQLVPLDSVEHLVLRHLVLSEGFLETLTVLFPNLHTLEVVNCEGLDCQGLMQLTKLTKLQVFAWPDEVPTLSLEEASTFIQHCPALVRMVTHLTDSSEEFDLFKNANDFGVIVTPPPEDDFF